MTVKRRAKILSDRESAFVEQYLINGQDPQDAALKAGYAPDSVKAHAYGILNNDRVQKAIAKRTGEALGEMQITRNKVLQEIARLAFLDPQEIPTHNCAVKLKALELLGKNMGLFIERVVIEDNTKKQEQVSQLIAELNKIFDEQIERAKPVIEINRAK